MKNQDFHKSFKGKSLLENYNRLVSAKNRRLDESNGLLKSILKEDFDAVDKGVIDGYEEDSKLDGDGYHEWDVTLELPLDLGNNYTDHHFVGALQSAYGEDSELMSFLDTEVSLSDTINFYFTGNYGKHEDIWAMSDLGDFLR